MMFLFELFLALVGFACLSISMSRHHRDIFGSMPAPNRVRMFKAFGVIALLACSVICVGAWGWAVGLTRSLLLMAAAGSLIVIIHTYGQSQIAGVVKSLSKPRSST